MTTTMTEQPIKHSASTFVNANEHHRQPPKSLTSHLLPYIMILIWPCMMALPLLLTIQHSPLHYSTIFPLHWYDTTMTNTATIYTKQQPKPLGLLLGILAVAIGQVFVWIFFYLYKYGYLSSVSSSSLSTKNEISTSNGNSSATSITNNTSKSMSKEPTSIQTKGSPQYEYVEGIRTHIFQPEGFAVLTAYLGITWMYNLMPNSYYQFTTNNGNIQYKELLLSLIVQDGIQYVMHRLEHDASPMIYKFSHKPHHKFLNPRLFDAFNGSLMDTICMIIVPLYITANIVRTCNVWTYMAFGSTYACWLTLIHSEYPFIWDPLFRIIGFGTPADHHVHHAFFKYNYGHLFMWYDQIFGTYQSPTVYIPKSFNVGV